jgi:hypothetical protein
MSCLVCHPDGWSNTGAPLGAAAPALAEPAAAAALAAKATVTTDHTIRASDVLTTTRRRYREQASAGAACQRDDAGRENTVSPPRGGAIGISVLHL